MFATNPLTTCFRQTHTLIADRLPHANHVAVIAEQTFYTLTDSSTLMGRAIKCLSFGALIGAITYPFIPYILPPEESGNAHLYAIAYAAVVAYKSWVDETDEQRIKRLIANLLNPTNDTNQPQPAHSTEQSSVQRRAVNKMESHALIPALYRCRNAVSSIYPETSSPISFLSAKTLYRASSPLQAIIACNAANLPDVKPFVPNLVRFAQSQYIHAVSEETIKTLTVAFLSVHQFRHQNRVNDFALTAVIAALADALIQGIDVEVAFTDLRAATFASHATFIELLDREDSGDVVTPFHAACCAAATVFASIDSLKNAVVLRRL
jgi:hypothetical protein